MDRRDFLKYGLLAGLTVPMSLEALAASVSRRDTDAAARSAADAAERAGNAPALPLTQQPICLFTKPIDHFSHDEIVRMIRDAGYDGADLTFRAKGGHIKPTDGRVEIPKFVQAAAAAGLSVPMAVTDIWDADDPLTVEMIRVMADNGIRHYRLVKKNYDKKLSISQNLEKFRANWEKLAALNARYGVTAQTQNHAGTSFNAAVWDGWFVYRDFDPRSVGAQYDIRHAMVDGMTTWEVPLRAAAPHIGTLAYKNFTWERQSEGGFRAVTVPMDEGIVPYAKFFGLLRELHVSAPGTMHVEFPVLTPEQEKLSAARQMDAIVGVLRVELEKLRKLMND